MSARRVSMLLTVLVVLFAFGGSRALAQQGTASLNGQVKDPSGLAVVGAKVQALNTGTNVPYSADTNEAGLYNFPVLPAGTYQLTATKEGFQQLVRPGVELHVSDVITLNCSLEIGAVTQSVTVEGGAPLVETTSASLGGLVNDQKIADLPLNGRNYIDLSLLQAGVTQSANMGTVGFGGMTGTTYSANGAPIISNNFTLDGTQIGNQSGWGAASFGGTTLGVDGIKEYKVVTSAFDASYGMSMGSQMVMISKGGANQFHGDVFEYLRNSALNARNFFDGATVPQLEKNNFGGSFGGPIRKDKTFFYAVYEGLRETLGFTAVDQVPAAGCHAGTGPGGQAQAGDTILAANCPQLAGNTTIPGGAADPTHQLAGQQIAAMLSLFPNPTNTTTNQFAFGPPTTVGVNYGQIRVDQNFSASDILFGRYTTDQGSNNAANVNGIPITSGTAFPQFRGGGITRDHFFTLSETHILSATVSNSARLAYSRTDFGSFRIQNGSLPAGLPSFIPGEPFGVLSIPQLAPNGFGSLVGPPNSTHIQNVYSLADDIYWQRGKHALRFGTLMNRFTQALTVPVTSTQGAVTYGSFAGFLLGEPLRVAAELPPTNIDRNFIYNTFGFYAQDDWHMTARLTLNLGLRYEFLTTPRESNPNNEYAIRNAATDATFTQGPIMQDKSYLNFSPRFGFAWDVFGDGKTAVRGGGGIYYDIGNLGGVFIASSDGTLPLVVYTLQNATNPQVITFPVAVPTTAQALSNGTTLSPNTVNYHANQPHVVQFNLSIQRQLPRNTAISIAYVGSVGAHLWQYIEGNPVGPTSGTVNVNGTPTPYLSVVSNGVPYWSSAVPSCAGGTLNAVTNTLVTPTCRTNPNFASWALDDTGGIESYNSLQVVVNKRLGGGLEAQGAYTYAHSLARPLEQLAGADCPGAAGMDAGVTVNQNVDYGPSCFDIRHNLRLSLLYHFPNLKSRGLLGKVANGWWMGNIVSVETGYPFSPLLANNRSNSANRGGAADRPNINRATVTAGQSVTDASGTYTAAANFVPYDPNTVITGNPNQWFNPQMFSLQPMVPCPTNAALTCGTLGDAARGMLRGPGLGNWDFSLVKDTAFPMLGEQGSVEFRAEFFNILNHTNFGMPSTAAALYSGKTSDKGAYSEAPSSGVGQITQTATTSRQIQFAVKVIF